MIFKFAAAARSQEVLCTLGSRLAPSGGDDSKF